MSTTKPSASLNGVAKAQGEFHEILSIMGLANAPAYLGEGMPAMTLSNVCIRGAWLDHWMARAEKTAISFGCGRLWNVNYRFAPDGYEGRPTTDVLLAEDATADKHHVQASEDLPTPMRRLILQLALSDSLVKGKDGFSLVPATEPFRIDELPSPGDILHLHNQSGIHIAELMRLSKELEPVIARLESSFGPNMRGE